MDPLATLDASSITGVTLYRSGEPQPTEVERAQAIARAFASLKAAPKLDGRQINWASATQVRARTADGLVLTLQVVPADAGALARITADAAVDQPEVERRARAIRKLRHNAYKLNNGPAGALLTR